MINFVPFSSNTSSVFTGSSRAIPKAGPDQPIDNVILTAESTFFSLIKSLITSNAFSVTVNIKYPPFIDEPFSIHLLLKIAILDDMSINFWKNSI